MQMDKKSLASYYKSKSDLYYNEIILSNETSVLLFLYLLNNYLGLHFDQKTLCKIKNSVFFNEYK